MDIQAVWEKADSLRGCLSSTRTTVSRRRHATDEDPLLVENLFVSDEAKIAESKAHRVLSEKTQVFSFTETPIIRKRSTHVDEVRACSAITSELLGLNTDLVRASAEGHDIGHGPFGHQGEAWIAKAMGRPFCHEVMGVIVAQKVERKGKGLNLTWHTLEAMLCHSGERARPEMSPEAWVLRYADKFAYLFADWNDIVGRMKYPAPRELRDLMDSFGDTQRARTTTAIAGLVIETAEKGRVSFDESDLGRRFQRIRKLMYEIYPRVTQQNVGKILEPVLECLTRMAIADPFLILALMTDRDAKIMSETTMPDMQVFKRTAVSEIADHLSEIGEIDLCDPGLEW